VGAFSCAVIMAGQLGVREQAAHQIALTLATITYMMASGVSAATTVRVGNMFGLKNGEEIRNAGFSSVVIILLLQLACALIFIVLHNYLPSCFNKETTVIEIASSLLIIAALFQVSDGIQVVCLGALRGMEDTKIPTIITLFAYWIVSLPISYFLAFHMHLGIAGVWYGLLLGLTIAAVLLYWRFNHISKLI
jgi:multidrug resistance protein, MATE family